MCRGTIPSGRCPNSWHPPCRPAQQSARHPFHCSNRRRRHIQVRRYKLRRPHKGVVCMCLSQEAGAGGGEPRQTDIRVIPVLFKHCFSNCSPFCSQGLSQNGTVQPRRRIPLQFACALGFRIASATSSFLFLVVATYLRWPPASGF